MLAKNFQRHDAAAGAAGTQFTCFTSTKVQILTQKLGQGLEAGFTSTKVQILTRETWQLKLPGLDYLIY